jgi:hypothetical protein
MSRPFFRRVGFCAALIAILTLSDAVFSWGADAKGGSKKKETSNLRVEISGEEKPVRGVVIFVQAQDEDWSDEQTTNSRGIVSFSGVPRGRMLIQWTPPKEWKDSGDYYTVGKAEEVIQIKLQKNESSTGKEP